MRGTKRRGNLAQEFLVEFASKKIKSMKFYEDICRKYTLRFGEKVKPQRVFRSEMTWLVDAEILWELAFSLKTQDGFLYLVDVSSVDNLSSEPRFEVVYELCNLDESAHLRLKTTVNEKDCKMASVSNIWQTANWHEREIFDMMGIRFEGHPDLRRILMWEDYPFYPLRKDFPLEGKPSHVPDVAFTQRTPMAGGPFVTKATSCIATKREPRAQTPEEF